MSIAQRLNEYQPAPGGRGCSWCEEWRLLSKTDRAAISEAMNDPRISDRALGELLAEEGLNMSRGQIGRHRRGECRHADQ